MIKKLEKYRQLQKKVAKLAKRLERLSAKPDAIISDSVRASAKNSPYQEHIVTVTGLGGNHVKTYLWLESRYQKYIKEMQENIVPIKEFINTIDCDDISHILDCYYLRGMTWDETAKEVYEYASADTPRKAVNRFFKASKSVRCRPCQDVL